MIDSNNSIQTPFRISEDSSKRITVLRFVLMSLVLFGHNNYTPYNPPAGNIPFEPNIFSIWVQRFISDGLARGTVQAFFIFSSYLLFLKEYDLKTLFFKKVKALFIPFMLWPILNMIVFSIAGHSDISSWGVRDWIQGFTGYLGNGDGNLYLFQFWYLRDLIILTCLSPIFRIINKKNPYFILIFAIAARFSGLLSFYFFTSETLVYWSIGMIIAIKKQDLFSIPDKFHPLTLLALFIAFIIYAHTGHLEALNFLPLIGIMTYFNFSKYMIKNEKLYNVLQFLASYSFFMYCIHIRFIRTILRTLWIKFFPMTNGFWCLFEYFGVTILMISISTLIGIALKKICKPVFNILAGGR